MRRTKPQQAAAQSLYQIGYKYLCDNFHKFKEIHKIKISLAILSIFEKDDSKTKNDIRQIVVMNDVVKDGNTMRYNFDQTSPAGDTEDSGQTRLDTLQP